MKRVIKEFFPTTPTMEGAGVRLHRGFGYHEVPRFDPFLLLDDFGSPDPNDYLAGFPWHPHRGIETVTYMVSGEVEHEDSLGNKGMIQSGDVQWMTAGSGIIHQEMPKQFPSATKGFQLWVNLPHEYKMSEPQYRGLQSSTIPLVTTSGVSVKVIAGLYGTMSGPLGDTAVDTFYFDVALESGKKFNFDVPAHFTVFLYVFEGDIRIVDSRPIGEGFVALTERGETVEIEAGESGARFLLIGGEPIGEPVAWHGPIVMNTHGEILEALSEYRKGTFVKHA